MLLCGISLSSLPPHFLPLPPSSTNLTELFKTVHLLAALSPTDLPGGELLRSARALTAATSGVLNVTQPENIEMSNNY